MCELVIFGYAKTAKELAHLLREKGRCCQIISHRASAVQEAQIDGFESHWFDLTQDSDLKEIGIGNGVKTLFCMDEELDQNLFATLSARALDPDLVIISRISSLDEEVKMKLAGASHTVDPYDLGSHRIYRLIKKPRVFDLLDNMIFQNMEYKIDEVVVKSDSTLIGTPFHQLSIEKEYELLLLGVESRGKFFYNTHRVYHKIQEGDTFVVAGNQQHITHFIEEMKGCK